jgi:hypothetical protein
MKTAAGIRLVRGNHLVWSSVTSAKYLWARGLDGLADRLLTIASRVPCFPRVHGNDQFFMQYSYGSNKRVMELKL